MMGIRILPTFEVLLLVVVFTLAGQSWAQARPACMATLSGQTSQNETQIIRAHWQEASAATNRLSPYIQVPEAELARLDGSFIVEFDEQFQTMAMNRNATGADTGVETLAYSVVVSRGMGQMQRMPRNAFGRSFSSFTNQVSHTDLGRAYLWHQEIMNTLFERYDSQGVEVSSGTEDYRQQDVVNSPRTTNFDLIVDGAALGHLQAMYKGRGLLNAEENFPEYRAPDTGGRVFELGRFTIGNNELRDLFAEHFSGNRANRNIAQLVLYQKMFAWLNHDAGANLVIMQVNDQMKRVLSHPRSPIKFDRAIPVVGETGVREWVLEVEPRNLELTEELITRQLLSLRLQKWLGDGQNRDRFIVALRPNERAVLARLGILTTNPQTRNAASVVIPAQAMTNAYDLFIDIPLERVQALITALGQN